MSAAKKATKRKDKQSPGADVADAIAKAQQAGTGKSKGARAVAAFLAFVNAIEPETVEAIGDVIRERDTHRGLGMVTEASIEAARQHGFGG
jgi:hypothetical protein